MSDQEEDVVDSARQFIAGISSDYFQDVCVALRGELEVTDPAQAAALDALRARLFAMRDLLKRRLRAQEAVAPD